MLNINFKKYKKYHFNIFTNKIHFKNNHYYNIKNKKFLTSLGPTSQAKNKVVKAAKYSLLNVDSGSIIFICHKSKHQRWFIIILEHAMKNLGITPHMT